MASEHLELYDAERNFADKAFRSACYAPFVSLYFDQFGFVRVCCQNFQHTLGNVAHHSLDAIWTGERARNLRSALRKYNFNLGCEYCRWQLEEGNYNNFARQFDRWPVSSEAEFWPAQMEFSISNTCNLECIMCNGEWSSSIRTRREKLPPIRKVYDDRFFQDLRKYLPRLKWLKILGGEPFLAHESYRIWDMLIEEGLQTPCHVTTNGTQYSAKVQRILDRLPISFSISMDGVTKETVERVRKNADFDTLRANFRRFHEYARQRGTDIGLTYCLMPANYHEFGEYLLFADEWDCDVTVNTVLHPPAHSLYAMSAEELRPIVASLETQGERVLPQLRRNRQVWINEFERVRHRMQHAGTEVLSFLPGKLVELAQPAPIDANATERQAREILSRWSKGGALAEVLCDPSDVVVELRPPAQDFLGVSREECLGRPFELLYPLLRMRYGNMTTVHRQDRGPFLDRYFGFTSLELVECSMRMLTCKILDAAGNFAGSHTFATVLGEPFRRALIETS